MNVGAAGGSGATATPQNTGAETGDPTLGVGG